MCAGNQGGPFGGRLSVGGVAEVCRIFSVFDSVVSGNSLSVGSFTRMLSVASDSHVIIDGSFSHVMSTTGPTNCEIW
jgi:hypothetical protein